MRILSDGNVPAALCRRYAVGARRGGPRRDGPRDRRERLDTGRGCLRFLAGWPPALDRRRRAGAEPSGSGCDAAGRAAHAGCPR